jgi:hypothetical protein
MRKCESCGGSGKTCGVAVINGNVREAFKQGYHSPDVAASFNFILCDGCQVRLITWIREFKGGSHAKVS